MDFAEPNSFSMNNQASYQYDGNNYDVNGYQNQDYDTSNTTPSKNENLFGAATIEPVKKVDFFDIVQMKNAYPKVRINLIGNLHQEKVIQVPIEDEQDNADAQNK